MFLWMFLVVIQKEATCNGLDEALQRLHKAVAFLNVYDGSAFCLSGIQLILTTFFCRKLLTKRTAKSTN